MRLESKPIEEHSEVPLADGGRLERLVNQWHARSPDAAANSPGQNACFLISVADSADEIQQRAQLAELQGLVEAQGDSIVGWESRVLVRKDARTLLTQGVAEAIAERARQAGANMLVLDAELSPSQTRNLEDVTGLPICDREAVILNVFERNATTKRARLQVEIAHLEYLRPRIRGIGLNMDQQMGGSNKARGPGETASELLARRLDKRLVELRRSLAQLKRSDQAQRKHRGEAARVVLVGYTNAGKTSLMNALTEAELSARNRPFETLETTSRCLTRHGGDVILSDTVGFIRRLPERLLASFESTLAEVAEASLLLIVIDLSDPEAEKHFETTQAVLTRLGADDVPRLIAFNKTDRVSPIPSSEVLSRISGDNVYCLVSAQDPVSVSSLRKELLKLARGDQAVSEVFVPYTASDVLKQIYATCRVLSSTALEDGSNFTLQAPPHRLSQIEIALDSLRK